MAVVLVCDDEEKIRQLIRKYAEFDGFTVLEAANGLEAVKTCASQPVDIVLMDVMMPEMDGFEAVRRIKQDHKDLPFIMLTALGEEYDKVHGFDLGVDDYVVKPFSGRELMMRIHAVLRRSGHEEGSANVYTLGGLQINFDAHTVSVDGQRVSLSLKEYDLLVYLVKHEGQVMRREMILEAVWGMDFYGDERTLDTHVKLLRRDLGSYANHIVTVRGVGYRFEKESSGQN